MITKLARCAGIGVACLFATLPKVATGASVPERGFISKQPARSWEQALVSGNGKLGAMVYGEPLNETIVLNHARLFMPLHQPLPPPGTGVHLPEIRRLLAAGQYQEAADFVVELAKKEGYDGKRWTDPFIPAFDIRIDMAAAGPCSDYGRTVDFATGVASVFWRNKNGAFERKLFVSRADDSVVLLIRGTNCASVNCEIELATHPPHGNGGWNEGKMFDEGIAQNGGGAEKNWLTYRARFKRSWPGSLQGYEGVARVVTQGGSTTSKGAKIVVSGADEVLVLVRIGMLDDFSNSQISSMQRALTEVQPNFDTLLARHAKIHGDIFSRARLDLSGGTDRMLSSEELLARTKGGKLSPALLEKQFDAARYNILSSSGELFPNLQGVWGGTYGAPWSGDFTLNGNVQSAIAADLEGNMAECLLPFFDYLEAHLSDFRTNATRLYGCRGIHVPSRASSHGLNNHFDSTWPMTFWTSGAGWAAAFYYDYYLYSGDRQFLRNRAFPFMKVAAAFYEDFLTEGADGKLLFSPSYSPENHTGNSDSQACINATMDVGVARELLSHCISAAEILHEDAAAARRWRGLLAKLPEYQINSEGAVKEWSTPLLTDNDAHRHCSHLYALYNGMPPEIASDAPLRHAFEVSLEKRLNVRREEFSGKNGPGGRPPGEMAFGIVFEGLSAASLHNARDCAEVVQWLSQNYWQPNFATTHNPNSIFNTDLCGGFPAILIRMLVDSAPGRVELLPALPDDWPAGKIEGIRCRGQISIPLLAWTTDKILVTLKSEISQKIELRGPNNMVKQIDLQPNQNACFEFPRTQRAARQDLTNCRNPIWVSEDNLRDPSVIKTDTGYLLFYSRFSAQQSEWGNPAKWTIASAFTKDFVHFENVHDISPTGCASPGDVVQWHERWLLPYQTYPSKPTQLVFSESADMHTWSTPKPFLTEALNLPWNEMHRAIDPSFVVDGDTLHCWFVGSAFHTDETGKKIRCNLMGHAITKDPNLEKWEILTPASPLIGYSEHAPDGVENTMVFRTGDHWTMIYSEGLVNQHLALATSQDLVKWTLAGPIEIERQPWMANRYGAPFVWKDGDRWVMILMGEDAKSRTTFGLLTSTDGRMWNQLPAALP